MVSGSSADKESTWFDSWVQKFPWRRIRVPTPLFLGFPGGSDGKKESACSAGDLGSIPGLGGAPGGGHGNPLQYSCLENAHGQRSWQAMVLGVAELDTEPPKPLIERVEPPAHTREHHSCFPGASTRLPFPTSPDPGAVPLGLAASCTHTDIT